MTDLSSHTSPHNEERKVVLTLAGTYGRERHASPYVTLTVPYNRLSYTLQQIHRRGGKVLDIAVSTSPFPTVAPTKAPESAVPKPIAPVPKVQGSEHIVQEPVSQEPSLVESSTAKPAIASSSVDAPANSTRDVRPITAPIAPQLVAARAPSSYLPHRSRHERSLRARRQVRQYLRRSQLKHYYSP